MYLNSLWFSKCYGALIAVSLLLTAAGCETEKDSSPDAKKAELKSYKTLVAVEENILAVPSVLRVSDNSHLFVYDKNKGSVLELDVNGQRIQTYGRKGRGPGEFLQVNNIFVVNDHIYIVDSQQYLIHKYNSDGEVVSTMDYGKVGGLGRPNVPPAPVSNSAVYAENINNKPVVTLQGNILISTLGFSDSLQSIYELMDWQGNHMANIGDVPKGSSFILDYEVLKSEIDNRKIPSFYKPNVFPVNDKANVGEYFLVYSALPKIAKFDSTGRQLWETKITQNEEVDSLTTHFLETMDRIQQSDRRNRIVLEYYVSGVSSPSGDIFLAMDTNPLWIHQFNSKGRLIKRYQLISKEIELLPIFDIDFKSNRILVSTEEGEVRAYPF